MKRIILILSAIVLSACFGDVSVELTKDNVQFIASLSSYGEKIQDGYKVAGQLTIINNSDIDIAFSNKDLFFILDKEGKSRTYVDSVASRAIDFSPTTIEKGSTLKQDVYWVLPPVKSLKSEQLFLEWHNQ